MKLFIFILLSFNLLNPSLVYASNASNTSNCKSLFNKWNLALNSRKKTVEREKKDYLPYYDQKFLAKLDQKWIQAQVQRERQEQTQILKQAQTLEQVQKSVWMIYAFSMLGTGFFISPNQFVTNFHVVSNILMKNDSKFTLYQKGGLEGFKVKKIKHLSPLHDLAVLEIEGKVSDYLSLAEKNPNPKDNLFLVGYPYGNLEIINRTNDFFYENEFEYAFVADRSPEEGISGSPVLNQQGEVAGVMHASRARGLSLMGISLFTKKISHLKNLLEQKPLSFENPKDHLEHSMKELVQEAEDGNAQAQYVLGYLYKDGIGIEKNLEKAKSWFERAAKQGHAEAKRIVPWWELIISLSE